MISLDYGCSMIQTGQTRTSRLVRGIKLSLQLKTILHIQVGLVNRHSSVKTSLAGEANGNKASEARGVARPSLFCHFKG